MKNKAPNHIPVLLTVAEAAERCRVCTKTVRRWIENGLLRIYRPGGGRLIRIAESDIAEFIKDGRDN